MKTTTERTCKYQRQRKKKDPIFTHIALKEKAMSIDNLLSVKLTDERDTPYLRTTRPQIKLRALDQHTHTTQKDAILHLWFSLEHQKVGHSLAFGFYFHF